MPEINKQVGLGHRDNFDALYDAVASGHLGIGLGEGDGLNRGRVLDSLNQAYEKIKDTDQEFLVDVANELPDTADSVQLPLGALNYVSPEIIEIIKAPMASDYIADTVARGVWGARTIQFQTKEPRGKTIPYVGKPIGSTAGVNYTADVMRGVYYHQDSWTLNDLDIAEAGLAKRPIVPDSQEASIFTIKKTNDEIFFKGVALSTNGSAPVYGLLNDTSLSSYTGVTGGTWANAISSGTPDVILNQIGTAVAKLNENSQGRVMNEMKGPTGKGGVGGKLKLIVPPLQQGLLNTQINQYGLTLKGRLEQLYNIDVIASAFLDGANSGADVFYLIYEPAYGAKTLIKPVVEEVRLYPVVNLHATQEQLIASAVSGCIVQRPYYVVRYTGI